MIKKFYHWIALCSLAGGLLSCASAVQDNYSYPSNPDLVVYSYCSADAYGAKLVKETAKSISRFNAISNIPELTIDKIYVIREFKVSRTQVIESYATVWVHYDFLAILQPNNQIPLDPRVTTLPNYAEFVLVLENGLWKIKKGMVTPCITKDKALEYLGTLRDIGTAEEKDKIELLIHQLEILN
jgi:hypothetical protein